jgi:hypothetical protein
MEKKSHTRRVSRVTQENTFIRPQKEPMSAPDAEIRSFPPKLNLILAVDGQVSLPQLRLMLLC